MEERREMEEELAARMKGKKKVGIKKRDGGEERVK